MVPFLGEITQFAFLERGWHIIGTHIDLLK